MNHQTFVVIATCDLTEEFLEEFHQDSLDTVRTSLDGKSAILAFEGEKPRALAQYEAAKGAMKTLTHDEALALMHTPQWTRSQARRVRSWKRYLALGAAALMAAGAAIYFAMK
jgi:hypothetical protein